MAKEMGLVIGLVWKWRVLFSLRFNWLELAIVQLSTCKGAEKYSFLYARSERKKDTGEHY